MNKTRKLLRESIKEVLQEMIDDDPMYFSSNFSRSDTSAFGETPLSLKTDLEKYIQSTRRDRSQDAIPRDADPADVLEDLVFRDYQLYKSLIRNMPEENAIELIRQTL